MDSIATKVAKNKVNNMKDKLTGSFKKKKYGHIKWNEDYNFPPFIGTYHFSMDEIE